MNLALNSKAPNFEELYASKLKSEIEVLTLLNHSVIYGLLGIPVPSTYKEIMDWMIREKMIVDVDNQGYYITNFGALAAANSLSDFDSIQRKSVRIY